MFCKVENRYMSSCFWYIDGAVVCSSKEWSNVFFHAMISTEIVLCSVKLLTSLSIVSILPIPGHKKLASLVSLTIFYPVLEPPWYTIRANKTNNFSFHWEIIKTFTPFWPVTNFEEMDKNGFIKIIRFASPLWSVKKSLSNNVDAAPFPNCACNEPLAT